MRNPVPRTMAELIGTFALTFVGGAAIINGQAGLLGVAVAHGLTLAVMISALGHVSGAHFNPAVTAGFLITRRLSLAEGAAYVVSQLAGAILAALALLLLPAARGANLGAQSLAPGVSFGTGVALEVILGFFLVLVVFATAVDPKGTFRSIAGFAIGLTVTFCILGAGPVTGASLNPARSFGPALVSGFWPDHLVYWIGPLLGGMAAAVLYDRVFMSRS